METMAERVSFPVKIPDPLSRLRLAEKLDENPELQAVAQAVQAVVQAAETAEATGGTAIKQ